MRLGYVIVYVPDVRAAVAFYEDAFGLVRRFVHEGGQYAELETGATALAFVDEGFVAQTVGAFAKNQSRQMPAGAEIGLIADDVASAYEKALKAGAAPCHAPLVKPWGQTVAYVRDLNGFLVEICSAMAE